MGLTIDMGLKFWRLWIDEEKKELEEMVRRKTGNEILAVSQSITIYGPPIAKFVTGMETGARQLRVYGQPKQPFAGLMLWLENIMFFTQDQILEPAGVGMVAMRWPASTALFARPSFYCQTAPSLSDVTSKVV